MIFLHSLIEKYVGKSFEIDCFDIEIHGKDDHQPPLFKGPGVIKGKAAGALSFKLHNQLPMTAELFQYIKKVKEGSGQRSVAARLFAKDYDGITWHGGWLIPDVDLFTESQKLVVYGELDGISTRVAKLEVDSKRHQTELIFAGTLDIPFSGCVHEKRFHWEEVISTSSWHDHHRLKYREAEIIFQESQDRTQTSVSASHFEGFASPYVDGWLSESLSFVSASIVAPRMIIRHFAEDSLVSIRNTPEDCASRMPRPFSSEHIDCIWEIFIHYLAKCHETQSFEPMPLSSGFSEQLIASTATVQGFLISLATFIENCVKDICQDSCKPSEEYAGHVKACMEHVKKWDGNEEVRTRAEGLIAMLNNPHIKKLMDELIDRGVITKEQKDAWNKVRHRLAHGSLLDFSRIEEFWDYRNRLISMMYRLIFRKIGYSGKAPDYSGTAISYVDFAWK